MTKKEFQEIGKSLLRDLPGFALNGQLVFICPIDAILRAFFFARSIDPRGFYVEVFFQPLFVPVEVIGFNIGWRLGGGSYLWRAEDPALIEKLSIAIKREVLPFLLPPKSSAEVAQVIASLQASEDPYVQQAIAYCFAHMGYIDKAIKELDRLLQILDIEHKFEWQTEMSDRAVLLKSLLQTDPPKARHQLNAWQVLSSRNLGLEKFLRTP